jgi:hypothetical protein
MMKDASQQQTGPRSSRGLCKQSSSRLPKGVGNAAYSAVAAAAGLVLLAGVAFAVTGCHAKVAPAPSKPAAHTTQPAGPIALPASKPAPSSALVSPVDSQKKTSANKTHTPSELLALNKIAGDHKSAKRPPYVPQTPPASATEESSALHLATSAAAGPFVLCIEGDVRVANYDAGSGTIETYERQTYVLNPKAGASGTIPWQDFPINVHYRCDQPGNCTLYRRGETASAKLIR